MLGSNPTVPGDMLGEPGPPLSSRQLQDLLQSLRAQAGRPAIQNSSHREPPVNEPTNLDKVTHVRLKRHKLGPLQHTYEGPFKIVERVGRSCIKVQVGLYADGTPSIETHHWENAKPAVLDENQPEATKKKLGRKPGPAKGESRSNNNTTSTPTGNIMTETNKERPKRITRPPARYAG